MYRSVNGINRAVEQRAHDVRHPVVKVHSRRVDFLVIILAIVPLCRRALCVRPFACEDVHSVRAFQGARQATSVNAVKVAQNVDTLAATVENDRLDLAFEASHFERRVALTRRRLHGRRPVERNGALRGVTVAWPQTQLRHALDRDGLTR